LPGVGLISRNRSPDVVPDRIETNYPFEVVISSHGGKCRHGQGIALV
jgi:hypothetical protein